MNTKFSHINFYKELESSLPSSSVEQRKVWASKIIVENIEIKSLSGLLECEQKIATRFLWLLSELGELNSTKLFAELSFLFRFCDKLNQSYTTSFANFWLIAGVPLENEGKAIDLLFKWLLSPDTNVTIKSRSFLVLFKLTEKYPELKNELKLCLNDQKDRYTNNFKKRVIKILMKIEQ